MGACKERVIACGDKFALPVTADVRGTASQRPPTASRVSTTCAPATEAFFQHIDPAMKLMSRLLKQDRAPSEIVKLGIPRSDG
jgi:hypothetical protein